MSKLSEDYSRVVNRVYATRAEVIESLLQRAEEALDPLLRPEAEAPGARPGAVGRQRPSSALLNYSH